MEICRKIPSVSYTKNPFTDTFLHINVYAYNYASMYVCTYEQIIIIMCTYTVLSIVSNTLFAKVQYLHILNILFIVVY